jgi:glycosyltransferase involved in cell wall biosynthesis
LASQVYRDGQHQFVLQRGYTNVAKAYNDAIPLAHTRILVFCHQDVYFPPGWEKDFFRALAEVEAVDPGWGVLGAAGVRLKRRFWGLSTGVEFVGNFSTNVAGGAHIIDHYWPRRYPQRVDTLDEFLLVVKRVNAGFDEAVPNNHFYGADLCLRCAQQGLKSYAISAYVHHDSASKWVKSDFYESAAHMYAKYRGQLPIATTCVIIHDKDGRPRYATDWLGLMTLTLRSLVHFPKRRGARP